MTQEEMARRLGVTTPAVNKWEKGHTLPDIALVAPIARLLEITTDELLSFREELTEEEIDRFLLQVQKDPGEMEFPEVFSRVQGKIEEYPNCEKRIWQAAMMLQTCLPDQDAEASGYRTILYGWFEQCLHSKDEQIRERAAEALFYAFFNQEDYERAGAYPAYESADSPKRKLKEALLRSKAGDREDAYRIYEELILKDYTVLQQNLNSLRILYMEDNDHAMVRKLVQISSQAAAAFQMGRYHEVCPGLDAAAWERDADWTVQILQEMVEHVDSIGAFTSSSLYQHMELKALPKDFSQSLKSAIADIFADEKFDYMKTHKNWEELRKRLIK